MRTDEIESIARLLAKRCRWIVQDCLREEEWGDAENEFFLVIVEELAKVNGHSTG